MTIKEYLDKNPHIDRKSWWEKVNLQYIGQSTEDILTNYMVYMDMPFWKVEALYDIAYKKLGDKVGTTFCFMVETEYDEELSKELEAELTNTINKGA